MKKFVFVVPVLLVLFLSNSCRKIEDPIVPPTNGNTGSTTYSSALDVFIKQKMDNAKIPGLALAVIRNHKIDFIKGYGTARVDNGNDSVRVTASTTFYTGNLVRPILATMALQLHEERKLDIDADVNQYLPTELQVANPSYPTAPITLRMLVSRASTITDHSGSMTTYFKTTGDSNVPLLDCLKDCLTPTGNYYAGSYDLTNKPGRVFHDSKMALALAGYVIESVSKINVDHYANAFIWNKLGTFNQSWFLHGIEAKNAAHPFHDYGVGPLELVDYGAAYYPGGQLRINVEHLSRYWLSIIEKGSYGTQKIIEDTTLTKMRDLAYPTYSNVDATGMMLDNSVMTNFNLMGVSASIPGAGINANEVGYCNRMYYEPTTGIGVILLTNFDGADVTVDEILNQVFMAAQ